MFTPGGDVVGVGEVNAFEDVVDKVPKLASFDVSRVRGGTP
jgi:hypothetical protein